MTHAGDEYVKSQLSVFCHMYCLFVFILSHQRINTIIITIATSTIVDIIIVTSIGIRSPSLFSSVALPLSGSVSSYSLSSLLTNVV